MTNKEILKAYGSDYYQMTYHLLESADLALEIGDKKKRILIKPNLVTPSPADYGATTHSEVVAGIIEYLLENEFTDITVAEGSWVGDKTSEAFDICGYNALAAKYGVKLIDTQKDGSYECDCAGISLKLCSCVKNADYIINVPVLKGHCQTKVTCALKNMKGLIPNSEKRRFHTMWLHKPIAHLNAGIHQDFIVVDHICGDLNFEEGGNPVIRNCIMAAKDPVLIDAYACAILGYETADVPYIKLAESLGIGCADLDKAVISVIEGDAVNDSDSKNHFLDVNYAVDDVDSCSACYAMLVPALLQLREEGLLDKMPEKISIGQGHKGKPGIIGVGQCTSAFTYSIKGCPPSSAEIYEQLKRFIESHCQ